MAENKDVDKLKCEQYASISDYYTLVSGISKLTDKNCQTVKLHVKFLAIQYTVTIQRLGLILL